MSGRFDGAPVTPLGDRRPLRLAARSGRLGPARAADATKDVAEGTLNAWGPYSDIPVGGWYGLRNGYRGRSAMYLPPLLELLGLAEVTHDMRNDSMRALPV